MRFAHLTDLHISERPGAAEGALAAYQKAKSMGAEAILLGGDFILDAFEEQHERAVREWNAARPVLAQFDLPVYACLGNHDIWSLGDAWDKDWPIRELGMPGRYYAADLGDWRLIVLDSTHPIDGIGYVGKLDAEQMEFLAAELQSTTRPTLVMSHIPILSAAVFFDGENETSGNWRVPGAWMHIDARAIKDLLVACPHVKLCLSGHTHLAERVEYAGVTFINSGAVCGAWWNGKYHDTPAGFGLLDLHPDGSFAWEYVPVAD